MCIGMRVCECVSSACKEVRRVHEYVCVVINSYILAFTGMSNTTRASFLDSDKITQTQVHASDKCECTLYMRV